jgi:hypothetical protein
LRRVVSPFDRKIDVDCSTRHDSIGRGNSSTYYEWNNFPKLSVVLGVAQPRFSPTVAVRRYWIHPHLSPISFTVEDGQWMGPRRTNHHRCGPYPHTTATLPDVVTWLDDSRAHFTTGSPHTRCRPALTRILFSLLSSTNHGTLTRLPPNVQSFHRRTFAVLATRPRRLTGSNHTRCPYVLSASCPLVTSLFHIPSHQQDPFFGLVEICPVSSAFNIESMVRQAAARKRATGYQLPTARTSKL